MKESKAVYVTKRDIRGFTRRDYQVYVDNELKYNNLNNKYILTNDVGIQHNERRDTVIWNAVDLRKRHEARYLSVTPRQIYTYHKTPSFTEIGVGSVKALQKKKVKRIYLPETDDRGVGSDDLNASLGRKRKPTRLICYEQKETTSKCVGCGTEPVKKVVSATASPIIQMKCEFTSPRDSIADIYKDDKKLVTTTTQFEIQDEKADIKEFFIKGSLNRDNVKAGKVIKGKDAEEPVVEATVSKRQPFSREASFKEATRCYVAREGSIKAQSIRSIKDPVKDKKEPIKEIKEIKESSTEPSTREASLWDPSTGEPSSKDPCSGAPSFREPEMIVEPPIRQASVKESKQREKSPKPRHRGTINKRTKDRKARQNAGEPIVEVIKPLMKQDDGKDAVFSSDSLVQHIHNLDDIPNEFKQAGDPMENKIEREYRKMFVSTSKEQMKTTVNSVPKKSTSLLRRRFTALRKKKSNSGVAMKDSTETSPSVKDASISSDPPSLESKSFSNASNSPSFHPKTTSRPKDSRQFKKPYPKRDDQNWSQVIDSEYATGVKGMFKLWGKKFNLEDDPRKYEIIAERKRKAEAYKTPQLKIEPKQKEDESDKLKDKKEGKFSFFKRKLSYKDKGKKNYKKKDSVTTGRCEVKEGLVLKIGTPASSVKKRTTDRESSVDIKRTDWLLRFVSPREESKKSLKIRWNNKMYATSSSTVFGYVNKNPTVIRSRSETITSEESYSDDRYSRYKYSNKQNVNFVQNIEAWMIPQTVPDQKSPLIKLLECKDNTKFSSTQWGIDTTKTNKIIVLRTNNTGRLKNRDSSERLCIQLPSNYLSNIKTDELQQFQTSDEEVYKIVEYNTPSVADYGTDTRNSHASDKVKITINLNDDLKVLNAGNQTSTDNDKLVQGSKVYIPNKCDVIGVGIITQRNVRETARPILKIVEVFSDDESDRSSFKVVKKCEFAESYLQDFYKQYHPLGIDLFSWCVSDSHIQCYSDNSECHHICGTKSCPNMYDDYVTMMSSCCASSCSQMYSLENDSSFRRGYERYRILPKDSLEVFKKRKLYATEKAKWGDHGLSYSTPSNEERGVQNNWSQRRPCFSLNTNTDTAYQKNIAMPDYDNVQPWDEAKKEQGKPAKDEDQSIPGILILGGCKRGQIAPPKQCKLSNDVSEINKPGAKKCCEAYSTIDWTSHELEKFHYDLVNKFPTEFSYDLKRDFGQSVKTWKCTSSASFEQQIKTTSIDIFSNKLEEKQSEVYFADVTKDVSKNSKDVKKDLDCACPEDIMLKKDQTDAPDRRSVENPERTRSGLTPHQRSKESSSKPQNKPDRRSINKPRGTDKTPPDADKTKKQGKSDKKSCFEKLKFCKKKPKVDKTPDSEKPSGKQPVEPEKTPDTDKGATDKKPEDSTPYSDDHPPERRRPRREPDELDEYSDDRPPERRRPRREPDKFDEYSDERPPVRRRPRREPDELDEYSDDRPPERRRPRREPDEFDEYSDERPPVRRRPRREPDELDETPYSEDRPPDRRPPRKEPDVLDETPYSDDRLPERRRPRREPDELDEYSDDRPPDRRPPRKEPDELDETPYSDDRPPDRRPPRKEPDVLDETPYSDDRPPVRRRPRREPDELDETPYSDDRPPVRRRPRKELDELDEMQYSDDRPPDRRRPRREPDELDEYSDDRPPVRRRPRREPDELDEYSDDRPPVRRQPKRELDELDEYSDDRPPVRRQPRREPDELDEIPYSDKRTADKKPVESKEMPPDGAAYSEEPPYTKQLEKADETPYLDELKLRKKSDEVKDFDKRVAAEQPVESEKMPPDETAYSEEAPKTKKPEKADGTPGEPPLEEKPKKSGKKPLLDKLKCRKKKKKSDKTPDSEKLATDKEAEKSDETPYSDEGATDKEGEESDKTPDSDEPPPKEKSKKSGKKTILDKLKCKKKKKKSVETPDSDKPATDKEAEISDKTPNSDEAATDKEGEESEKTPDSDVPPSKEQTKKSGKKPLLDKLKCKKKKKKSVETPDSDEGATDKEGEESDKTPDSDVPPSKEQTKKSGKKPLLDKLKCKKKKKKPVKTPDSDQPAPDESGEKPHSGEPESDKQPDKSDETPHSDERAIDKKPEDRTPYSDDRPPVRRRPRREPDELDEVPYSDDRQSERRRPRREPDELDEYSDDRPPVRRRPRREPDEFDDYSDDRPPVSRRPRREPDELDEIPYSDDRPPERRRPRREPDELDEYSDNRPPVRRRPKREPDDLDEIPYSDDRPPERPQPRREPEELDETPYSDKRTADKQPVESKEMPPDEAYSDDRSPDKPRPRKAPEELDETPYSDKRTADKQPVESKEMPPNEPAYFDNRPPGRRPPRKEPNELDKTLDSDEGATDKEGEESDKTPDSDVPPSKEQTKKSGKKPLLDKLKCKKKKKKSVETPDSDEGATDKEGEESDKTPDSDVPPSKEQTKKSGKKPLLDKLKRKKKKKKSVETPDSDEGATDKEGEESDKTPDSDVPPSKEQTKKSGKKPLLDKLKCKKKKKKPVKTPDSDQPAPDESGEKPHSGEPESDKQPDKSDETPHSDERAIDKKPEDRTPYSDDRPPDRRPPRKEPDELDETPYSNDRPPDRRPPRKEPDELDEPLYSDDRPPYRRPSRKEPDELDETPYSDDRPPERRRPRREPDKLDETPYSYDRPPDRRPPRKEPDELDEPLYSDDRPTYRRPSRKEPDELDETPYSDDRPPERPRLRREPDEMDEIPYSDERPPDSRRPRREPDELDEYFDDRTPERRRPKREPDELDEYSDDRPPERRRPTREPEEFDEYYDDGSPDRRQLKEEADKTPSSDEPPLKKEPEKPEKKTFFDKLKCRKKNKKSVKTPDSDKPGESGEKPHSEEPESEPDKTPELEKPVYPIKFIVGVDSVISYDDASPTASETSIGAAKSSPYGGDAGVENERPCTRETCKNLYAETNATWRLSHDTAKAAAMCSLHAPIIRKPSMDTIVSLKNSPRTRAEKESGRKVEAVRMYESEKPKSEVTTPIADELMSAVIKEKENERISPGLRVPTAYRRSSVDIDTQSYEPLVFQLERDSRCRASSPNFKIKTDDIQNEEMEEAVVRHEVKSSHSRNIPFVYKCDERNAIKSKLSNELKTKSDTSIANIIEINFKLKVIQGDDKAQINVANDTGSLEGDKCFGLGKNERKQVLILDKKETGAEEINSNKNDVNIRILIKSFKPKTNGVDTQNTLDEFSQKISKKFDTVSTGRSVVFANLDANTDVSIHRADVEIEAVEKQQIEDVEEHHIEKINSELKSYSEHITAHVDFTNEDDKIYSRHDSEAETLEDETVAKNKEDEEDKLETEITREGTATEVTEKTMTSDTTKDLRNAVEFSRMFKSDTDVSIPLKSSEGSPVGLKSSEASPVALKSSEASPVALKSSEASPVGLKSSVVSPVALKSSEASPVALKTSDERLHSYNSAASPAGTTSGGTSHDQMKRLQQEEQSDEQDNDTNDDNIEVYDLKKSKKEEKKEMLKQLFEHDIMKRPKNKNRMRKFKNILKSILTSESDKADSDTDTNQIIVLDNQLARDITYESLKPNFFKSTDSLNNYYQIDEVSSGIADAKRHNPSANDSSFSEKPSKVDENIKKLNQCFCSTVAKKLNLQTSGDGGCCCRRVKPKLDREVNCDILGDQESLEKVFGCVEVQTHSANFVKNTNFTQVSFESNWKEDKSIANVKYEDYAEASVTLSKLFEPRHHLRECELKNLNHNTKLSISDDDKIVLVESQVTEKAKDFKKQSPFKSGADILQMYETKKAVLEIYAQKTVTKDGVKVVAKLPKFSYNREQEIIKNYEQIRNRTYGTCQSNDYFLI